MAAGKAERWGVKLMIVCLLHCSIPDACGVDNKMGLVIIGIRARSFISLIRYCMTLRYLHPCIRLELSTVYSERKKVSVLRKVPL